MVCLLLLHWLLLSVLFTDANLSRMEECLLQRTGATSLANLLPLPQESKLRLPEIVQHLADYSAALQYHADQTQCTEDVLMYTCVNGTICGGFGDRVLGATNVFFWSLVTGRLARFQWNNQISIGAFFESSNPALWNLDEPSLPLGHHLALINYFGDSHFARNWVAEWAKEPIVSVQANGFWAYHAFGWVNNTFMKERIQTFFPYLQTVTSCELIYLFVQLMLHPVPALESLVNLYMPPKRMFQIGIQFRLGDMAFGISKEQRHPADLTSCFVDKAIEMCRAMGEGCYFFLSSDSVPSQVEMETKLSRSPNHTIVRTQGVPIHVDLAYHDSWESHVKTYLDWVLLTRMDSLLISRSNFGVTAACGSQVWTQRHVMGTSRCTWDHVNLIASWRFNVY